MKNIISIAFVFTGLIIGAGFASGREILEYFSIPSTTDFTGISFAAISFGAVCYIIMSLARKCRAENFDGLITAVSGRLAFPIRIFMFLFMFCGLFIMMSACGVLTEEILGISRWYGIVFLAFICFITFSFNTKGLVAVNTILVPLMVFGMLFVCISSVTDTVPTLSLREKLKLNPVISSLCYVSYNTITAGAVLVPLSQTATKKQLTVSALLSGFIPGILILISWLCINRFFEALVLSEMPLLSLAAKEGDLIKHLYSAVLFMALCTTAVSHGFGILSKFSCKNSRQRITASAALCLAAIPFAGLGFSNLISNLYSLFGYMGFFWTALMLIKYNRF